MTPFDAKSPSESATTLAQVMFPEHANVFQTVHGGELLKMMDTAAGVCASRHQGGPVNTKALGGIVFHAPVPINCLCTCKAHITYIAEKVIEVYTELSVENTSWEKPVLGVTGYFYYVGIDVTAQKAVAARPLKVTTSEEAAAFEAGKHRLEQNLQLAKA